MKRAVSLPTVVAVAVFIFAYGQVAFWMISAARQAEKVRISLLTAILRQDVGWFDTHKVGELNTRLTEYVCCFLFVSILHNCRIRHVTASIATRKRRINLGQRLNVLMCKCHVFRIATKQQHILPAMLNCSQYNTS